MTVHEASPETGAEVSRIGGVGSSGAHLYFSLNQQHINLLQANWCVQDGGASTRSGFSRSRENGVFVGLHHHRPPLVHLRPQWRRHKRSQRMQKRGKRGGIRARLTANPHKPTIPTILLANVCSLDNKLDHIRLLRSTQKTVSAYINKCIDDVTVKKTITVRANQKPWMMGEVYRLLKTRNAAIRAGDEVGLRTAKANLSHFGSAFNTIIPQQLIHKLVRLGLNTSLCNWLLDFLTGSPQAVQVDSNTSSTITLNPGAPQGCVLSPLLFTLLTHDCSLSHDSNLFIKFADDTTVVGLISNNDETNYSSEVRRLVGWCSDNNLSLNVEKTKEIVVDFRRALTQHTPLTINGATVERVSSTKFLGVHITEDLSWTDNTAALAKKNHSSVSTSSANSEEPEPCPPSCTPCTEAP
ncbi:hypothetical protein Q8A73_022911 [Channa argus]|nr:hypothetical protein Q8A73_022911 [Channa argus]